MPSSGKWAKIFKKRFFYIIILVLTLYLLSIYYMDNVEKHHPYPAMEAIMTNYTVGDKVYVSGPVLKINDNGSFVIAVYYHQRNINFTIESPSSVKLKDDTYVYGILEPSYTVKSLKISVANKWDYLAVIIRSLLGLIILVVFFNKYWKLDMKKLLFIRRK